MLRLLLRLTYSRLTTVSLGMLIPLVLVHKQVDSNIFASYKAFEYLPYIVIGLLAGAVIDAYGANRILKWALIAHLPPTFIAAAVSLGWLPMYFLYLALFILSGAGYVVSSGISRIALDEVQKDELGTFNARTTLIDQASSLVIPIGAGWIAAQSLDAALSVLLVVSCLSLALLRGHGVKEPLPDSAWLGELGAKVRQGIASFLANSFLVQLSFIVMLINAVEVMPGTLLVFYASHELALDAARIGMLVTAAGLGGIAAAVVIERFARDTQALFAYLVASMLVTGSMYLVVYWNNSFAALMMSLIVESASVVISTVAFRTLRQLSAGRTTYGVVLGVSGAIVKLAIPPAVLVGGAIAAIYGVRSVYLAAGVVELMLAVPVTAWAFKSFRVRRHEF